MEAATGTVDVCDLENIEACSMDLDGEEEEPVVTVNSVNIYQTNLQSLDSPKCWLDCRVSEQSYYCQGK